MKIYDSRKGKKFPIFKLHEDKIICSDEINLAVPNIFNLIINFKVICLLGIFLFNVFRIQTP